MKCSVFNTLVIFAISLLEVGITLTLGENCNSFRFPNLEAVNGDCSKYMSCRYDNWIVERCPGGYLFDLVNKKCLPAHQARCGNNASPSFYNRWTPHDENVAEPSSVFESSETDEDNPEHASWKTIYQQGDKSRIPQYMEISYFKPGGSFKMTIYGEDMPQEKSLGFNMIDWVRGNKHRFKLTPIPYEKPTASSETAKPTRPPKPKPTSAPTSQPKPTSAPTSQRKPTSPPTSQRKPTQKPVAPVGQPLSLQPADVEKELLPSKCGADWHRLYSDDPNRIVGGKVTAIESVPWQVGLLDAAELSHQCGGSIITERQIITAAHCLRKRNGSWRSPSDLLVRVGDFDQELRDEFEKEYNILDLHRHKDYEPNKQINDIALITLTQTLTFNVAVFPICLPPDNSDKMFSDDSSCLISGWGATQSLGSSTPKLRAANTSLISRAKCIEGYPPPDYSIRSSMVCAGDFENGGVDTCQGDSGGPLACRKRGRFYLYGVTSWGIKCGLDHLPGVYTKVTSFRSWIIDTLTKTSTILKEFEIYDEEDIDEA